MVKDYEKITKYTEYSTETLLDHFKNALELSTQLDKAK